MEELKKVGTFIVRVGLWSTLIALFWTGMTLYWTRDDPDRTTTGLILVFVIVWICSLPITMGTEIGLLILRRLREKSVLPLTGATAHGEKGPRRDDAEPDGCMNSPR